MAGSGTKDRHERVEDIRRRWELVTDTGVVVRPTEALVQAMGQKGYDVRAAEALLLEGQRLYAAGEWDRLLVLMARIHHVLRQAPPVPLPSVERPVTLEAIRASLPPAPELPVYDWSDYEDRVLGGWLGKVIGGALGGPVEGWTRERIAQTYGTVTDYLAPPSSLNDDTAYPLVLLHAVAGYGPDFTSEQLALAWLERLPQAYTAEAIALENLRRGIFPPESGSTDNPFSHWVGAMMKAEICGWLLPGRPETAIELAYRDAVIAHETEGVYGALFIAAMAAAAFVESVPRRLIEIALHFVPPRSQFTAVARQVLRWCARAPDWTAAWMHVETEILNTYHWLHTFPNLAAVLVALWFGEGDFSQSITLAVQCGGDTDTAAGIVGAILGTAQGASAIPDRWRVPLGDYLESYVIGYERVDFRDLAARTVALGRMYTRRSG
ncbi:MAG: ADP-ribosylglycohydrolase family protein [Acidobacteria bacterium]|nr:ADP-ribosylglycohydrolase family protein [Acidobacteriota bacterium]MDW7983997.1 ADP-ribosylglycohydrolase family protein [Acidobacteriota bacterium]